MNSQDYDNSDRWADQDGIVHDAHVPAATVTRLSDVEPERVRWLWPGRLPEGKEVVLDGDPSLGKSTLAVTFAAHVSTGKPWPDGALCPLGDVVIMSAEDGLADTLRPRLDAAGGDPDRVHALTAIPYITEDGDRRERLPTLADITAIRATVEATGARLLIIDVLMAYMPSKVDSHRDQDVRGVLHQLGQLAEHTGCTVLLLRHLNKASGGNALYRGGGSIGIIGAARAGFLVAPDPDDDQVRVLACTKNNLAPMPRSLCYRLEEAPGSHVARVVWLGESTHDAGVLLNAGNAEERGEVGLVAGWLTGYLADNGASAARKDVLKAARAAGFAERTVERAVSKVGIESKVSGFPATATWSLPDAPFEKKQKDGGGTGEFGGTGADLREEPENDRTDSQFRQFRQGFGVGTTGVTTDQNGQLRQHSEVGGTGGTGGTGDGTTTCVHCGQVLLLVAPGRDTCEGCRLSNQPCDRCQATPTRVDRSGARWCETCAPHLWKAAS